MRLTHLADYAVVIMTAAARREAGARLSATELAQETGVPLPTTQKLMGQPCRRGPADQRPRRVAAASRSPGPPRRSRLADIVEAVEGPIAHDHVLGRRATMTACSTRIAG